jgi:hypothetical protein
MTDNANLVVMDVTSKTNQANFKHTLDAIRESIQGCDDESFCV